ncbi:PREDICTED: transmembrane channel-like protein 2 [Polistes dominula]|uniref:Transmembrane channel-like protein 2 n=1 Tax=Polistes dominula TaxID=743375 RepID=A0ABM1IXY0_POLDO|nr:PREDICTED: transmembrane channel-like protein 2 [Polistes dominula]
MERKRIPGILRRIETNCSLIDKPSVTFFNVKHQNKESVMSEIRELDDERTAINQSEMLNKLNIDEHEEQEECDEREEDDYSASASAIILRRNSSKRLSKRKRRTSSPFMVEGEDSNVIRRPSSAYTNSSVETGISIDEGGTQEQIFEKLKLHKEVLNGVKEEPWPLRKKMKLVRQAKLYVRKHEGVLKEKLAQNRNTKDVVARVSLLITKKWQYFRREFINLETWLIPWELRIKEIESHFGSAVASYFTFLRWLFWINFVITITLTAFVAVPEMLIADVKLAGERKIMPKEESMKSNHLMTLWEFEGILRYSPFFYGWYTNYDSKKSYRLPLAYFVTNLVVYTYSFVVILRKMAKNSRLSKLTEKEDECAFSWKLFTGWDFMIGNPETAHNRLASIIVSFKETLLEEAEKEKDKKRNWKIILTRSFVNVSVLLLLTLSAFIVVKVVARSAEAEETNNWWTQNEITLVMSLISYIFPIIFEVLGLLENYHPRKQLRVQLARIMVLHLLNLYTLIFALFSKISSMKNSSIELIPAKRNCTLTPVECVGNFIDSESSAVTLASLSLMLMGSVAYANITDHSIKQDQSDGIMNKFTVQYDGLIKQFLSDDTQFNYYHGDYNSNSEEYYDGNSIIDNISNIDDESNYTWSTTTMIDNEIVNETLRMIDYNLNMEMNNQNNGNKQMIMCYERVCTNHITQKEVPVQKLDLKTRKEMRRLCWETMYGQELAKLTVMDLVMTIGATLGMDFFRAVFVRYMNNCWCWDLEKQFPQYGDFKIAENILHLVNNQGMVWMGMFFSPGLAMLNLLKLGILMYLRSWAVLTCNVPHEIVFRASRSNNFYFALLLMMLFLCVLPVGYAIVWVEPSWHCGPFSGYPRIYMFATESLKDSLPEVIKPCLDYISSASMVIPLIVLMTLIIYYMVSLTGSLREANNDLKIQLRQERTEERRKLFKIAEKRQKAIDAPLFTRWKQILPVLPSSNSNKCKNSTDDSYTVIVIEKPDELAMNERKYSITSEEVGITDCEPESLPHDSNLHQQHASNKTCYKVQDSASNSLESSSSKKNTMK